MRHIRNYAKCRKMVKNHFAKLRKEESALIAMKEAAMADPKCDKGNGWYAVPEGAMYAGHEFSAASLASDRKYLKSLDGKEREWLERLDRADRLRHRLREFHISVDWKKSRTWGANPTAEIWVSYEYTAKDEKGEDYESWDNAYAKSSSIGGCGYDKRSTAVSQAIDRLDDDATAAFDRLVVEAGEKAWQQYVFDKTPFPHLSFSAKGMETFTALFPRMGNWKYAKTYPFPKFCIECDERSSVHDSYHCYRRDRI